MQMDTTDEINITTTTTKKVQLPATECTINSVCMQNDTDFVCMCMDGYTALENNTCLNMTASEEGTTTSPASSAGSTMAPSASSSEANNPQMTTENGW